MNSGSRFTLDGVMVTGRGLSVFGPDVDPWARAAISRRAPPRCTSATVRSCPAGISIARCTPASPNKESLEFRNVRARVRDRQEHSRADRSAGGRSPRRPDPDRDRGQHHRRDGWRSGGDHRPAGAARPRHPHGAAFDRLRDRPGARDRAGREQPLPRLRPRRATSARMHALLPRAGGVQDAEALQLSARSRHAAAAAGHGGTSQIAAARAREALRVGRSSRRDATACPRTASWRRAVRPRSSRGADDGAEMGVFHDLFQPQRLANVRARLEEFTPAGTDAGVILAS